VVAKRSQRYNIGSRQLARPATTPFVIRSVPAETLAERRRSRGFRYSVVDAPPLVGTLRMLFLDEK
jgi:hypothetical protein